MMSHTLHPNYDMSMGVLKEASLTVPITDQSDVVPIDTDEPHVEIDEPTVTPSSEPDLSSVTPSSET